MESERSEEVAKLLTDPANHKDGLQVIRINPVALEAGNTGAVSFNLDGLSSTGKGKLFTHYTEQLSTHGLDIDGIHTLNTQDADFFKGLAQEAQRVIHFFTDRDKHLPRHQWSTRRAALLLTSIGADLNPLELISALNRNSVRAELLICLADYQTRTSKRIAGLMGADRIITLTSFPSIIDSPHFPEAQRELAHQWWSEGPKGY